MRRQPGTHDRSRRSARCSTCAKPARRRRLRKKQIHAGDERGVTGRTNAVTALAWPLRGCSSGSDPHIVDERPTHTRGSPPRQRPAAEVSTTARVDEDPSWLTWLRSAAASRPAPISDELHRLRDRRVAGRRGAVYVGLQARGGAKRSRRQALVTTAPPTGRVRQRGMSHGAESSRLCGRARAATDAHRVDEFVVERRVVREDSSPAAIPARGG
jgi:hypothetical protein